MGFEHLIAGFCASWYVSSKEKCEQRRLNDEIAAANLVISRNEARIDDYLVGKGFNRLPAKRVASLETASSLFHEIIMHTVCPHSILATTIKP